MTQICPKSFSRLLPMTLFAGLLLAAAANAQSLPGFQKSFSPSTVGPGSISTLTFTITNGTTSPISDLSFTDSLPAGMTVADPATGFDFCQGTLSAAENDTSISYSGGAVPGSGSCTIEVNVTASTAGTHSNVTGDLTSSAGNSGTASADLTVSTTFPGFSKSFSPNPASFNGRVTLTLTVDNSANTELRTFLAFSDTLPPDMTIASPSNLSNTCGGTATAVDGGSSVGLSGVGSVAAGATCAVSVDVIAGAVGSLANLTGSLTSGGPFGFPTTDSGKAGDTLDVFAERLALTKTFVDDPVAPGDMVDLRFDLTNLDRRSTVTDINFTDDLDAALSGLVAVSLPASPCGAGSAISGAGVLSFTGGELAAGASCSFTVGLEVPASASAGPYTNTTGSVLGMSGAATVSGPPASDMLFVESGGIDLTKNFLDNPVGAGGSTTLEFTLTNSGTSAATDIAFTDELVSELPTASSVPAAGFCLGTGTATYTPLIDPPPPSDAIPALLTITGVTLDPGTSCTFQVTLDVSEGASPGSYTNTTSEVTATIDGEPTTGDAASDDLQIVGGPNLSKNFIDDPVVPGGTVTLEFTLTQAAGDSTSSATAITFTDDLSAVVSGLAATGLPMGDVCGTGSVLSGTTTLALSGGALAAEETCTFSVTLDVPAGAAAGVFTNVTSSVTADVDGVATTTPAASADLLIAGVSMTKEFIDDPVPAGGTVTLRYTIDNVGTTEVISLTFTDNLDSAVDNMAASGLPLADVCGIGSSLFGTSGNTVLNFAGGTLAAGTSCTFDVTMTVPSGTVDGIYFSTTSSFFGIIDGGFVLLENATAELEVLSELLQLTKEFTDDPVPAGGMVTLRFTVSNLSDQGISSIAFADDLDAAFLGLASVSGTLTDPCGPGSEFGGTGLLSLTGGILSGMTSCTFDVSVSVPSSATSGDPIVNVTSEATGLLAGVTVTGSAATDELLIATVHFSKAFGSATAEAGDTVSLSFTIENDSAETASELVFNDFLDAMLSGLVATGLPLADVCGAGSEIDGTSTLSFLGGTLPPGGTCTFSVDVVVPAFALPGVYVNVTENLRQGGLPVADPATATLEIIEIIDVDTDGDGVLDQFDVCAGTVIPESVPTIVLKPNRYALVDGDLIFDTTPPPGGGNGPGDVFTTTDTGGCSCEQIIEALGLGQGHVKFGCSIGAMRNWVNIVTFGPVIVIDSFEDGDLDGWIVVD